MSLTTALVALLWLASAVIACWFWVGGAAPMAIAAVAVPSVLLYLIVRRS